jgi:hypothetical protein
MHIVLFLAGAVSTVVGLLAVALGVPERAFSVGAVLMTCGAIASVGGVILIGLGVVVRQLRRLTDVLDARPALRPAANEVTEPELVPLSPKALAPGPETARPAPAGAGPDMRPAKAPGSGAPERATPEVRSPALAADQPSAAPEISAGQPMAPGGNASSEPRNLGPTNGAEAPKKREPMFRAGERARAELGLPPKPDPSDPLAPAMEERPAVLKSGVIEGMAYTLYADGSIDAELAEGTVKFNSIPELRAYLGHNSKTA